MARLVTWPAVGSERKRVLIVRGHLAAPWDLQAWESLPDRFDVGYLLTRRNAFDVGEVSLPPRRVRAVRDFLPSGRLGDAAAGVLGERYLSADSAFAGVDIVHAAELSFWFTGDVAKRKGRHGYKLVVTVWETLPLLDAFRNFHARVYRRAVLGAADLFLAATERARDGLLLEGVEPERVVVSYPGIDLERFKAAARPDPLPQEHVIISPGRLVWEKGHQDVMRALAALDREVVSSPPGVRPRLLVVGTGPERERLESYAQELGIGDRVEFSSVPYSEMPELYARASCMVLASLSTAACSLYLGDPPRCFWEEQFGLVLAEAMAAGLPVVASTSGAIPEVVGDSGLFFPPGDWLTLARLLAEGPLARPPAQRMDHPSERVEQYSTAAAAQRLTAAYDRVLGSSAAS
jgi:glycosyltransferase involved in cell wall biosynthesis